MRTIRSHGPTSAGSPRSRQVSSEADRFNVVNCGRAEPNRPKLGSSTDALPGNDAASSLGHALEALAVQGL